ncbi:cytochrome c oxidase VII [Trypanosoma theileri]|uniref:Cytochrome c oxidase VII n=1 Tax=Trypanosoma theileri TaxID=67003 RepID=A0A1X0NML5_9TRYP|nr:cytochrome c oxidase VII [Trypanosoma theileri]XP_028879799.1 cytochrome c oxidase VII [Trypanosoma theileri]ORC85731.1 cytochrome c oxidase VII [Trypanosoma theileri]ORC85733.1 cytochrome c oxidase VII [Trypanosoma theileri]
MPRPFGAWAPATTLAEFRSRVPNMSSFSFRSVLNVRREVYYHPEALAHFKDPQQYKDAVDTVVAMRVSDKFFGEGNKLPRYAAIKVAGALAVLGSAIFSVLRYYYCVYTPANNPTWRKVVNKEWEEAINNSPWDHMSHVWQYSDQYATVIGEASSSGRHKFYIPA